MYVVNHNMKNKRTINTSNVHLRFNTHAHQSQYNQLNIQNDYSSTLTVEYVPLDRNVPSEHGLV